MKAMCAILFLEWYSWQVSPRLTSGDLDKGLMTQEECWNFAAETNAKCTSSFVESLLIENTQVKKVPKQHTYGAHSSVNPHVSSACHIDAILTETAQISPQPEEIAQKKKISPKKPEKEKLKTQ